MSAGAVECEWVQELLNVNECRTCRMWMSAGAIECEWVQRSMLRAGRQWMSRPRGRARADPNAPVRNNQASLVSAWLTNVSFMAPCCSFGKLFTGWPGSPCARSSRPGRGWYDIGNRSRGPWRRIRGGRLRASAPVAVNLCVASVCITPDLRPDSWSILSRYHTITIPRPRSDVTNARLMPIWRGIKLYSFSEVAHLLRIFYDLRPFTQRIFKSRLETRFE